MWFSLDHYLNCHLNSLFKHNLIVHLSVKDRLRSSKVKFSGKNEKEVQVETDQSNFKQPCDWFLEISRWFLTGNALGTHMEKNQMET